MEPEARKRLLAGGRFDFFGRSEERIQERGLITEYNALVDWLISRTESGDYRQAVKIACLADTIKGFGYIKTENIKRYQESLKILKRKFENPELSVVING